MIKINPAAQPQAVQKSNRNQNQKQVSFAAIDIGRIPQKVWEEGYKKGIIHGAVAGKIAEALQQINQTIAGKNTRIDFGEHVKAFNEILRKHGLTGVVKKEEQGLKITKASPAQELHISINERASNSSNILNHTCDTIGSKHMYVDSVSVTRQDGTNLHDAIAKKHPELVEKPSRHLPPLIENKPVLITGGTASYYDILGKNDLDKGRNFGFKRDNSYKPDEDHNFFEALAETQKKIAEVRDNALYKIRTKEFEADVKVVREKRSVEQEQREKMLIAEAKSIFTGK